MNVFRSLDDELDGNGKASSHWWIIPFMVTVCFLWGVLGFLSGGTDRKTTTRTDAIAAGLTAAPEAPPRFAEPPGGIASEPESGLRPAPTTAVAPSVPALQSQPEKEPPKLAKVHPRRLTFPRRSLPIKPGGANLQGRVRQNPQGGVVSPTPRSTTP
jgi:hypothetical protein